MVHIVNWTITHKVKVPCIYLSAINPLCIFKAFLLCLHMKIYLRQSIHRGDKCPTSTLKRGMGSHIVPLNFVLSLVILYRMETLSTSFWKVNRCRLIGNFFPNRCMTWQQEKWLPKVRCGGSENMMVIVPCPLAHFQLSEDQKFLQGSSLFRGLIGWWFFIGLGIETMPRIPSMDVMLMGVKKYLNFPTLGVPRLSLHPKKSITMKRHIGPCYFVNCQVKESFFTMRFALYTNIS